MESSGIFWLLDADVLPIHGTKGVGHIPACSELLLDTSPASFILRELHHLIYQLLMDGAAVLGDELGDGLPADAELIAKGRIFIPCGSVTLWLNGVECQQAEPWVDCLLEPVGRAIMAVIDLLVTFGQFLVPYRSAKTGFLCFGP